MTLDNSSRSVLSNRLVHGVNKCARVIVVGLATLIREIPTLYHSK